VISVCITDILFTLPTAEWMGNTVSRGCGHEPRADFSGIQPMAPR
jgi:hypothetical protein